MIIFMLTDSDICYTAKISDIYINYNNFLGHMLIA